jgi:hypothetical protein
VPSLGNWVSNVGNLLFASLFERLTGRAIDDRSRLLRSNQSQLEALYEHLRGAVIRKLLGALGSGREEVRQNARVRHARRQAELVTGRNPSFTARLAGPPSFVHSDFCGSA